MRDLNVDKHFLASIVESSRDSIITINLDLEITSWNRAAEELYGYPAAEAIGNSLTSLTLPKDFQHLLTKVEKIKHSKEVEVFESERVGKGKGHMILEVVVSPVKDSEGEIIGISTIARDLTARRIAEKAVRDKEFLQRLIIAQEDERSRISRDLHDELGQELTALRFALQHARLANNDDEMAGHLERLDQITRNIDKSVDFLAWELRPASLEGVGLASAMDNYARQWAQHAGIEANLVCPSLKRVRLASKVETNLYRIMQEALNNTHKHADAKRVDLTLERDGDMIKFSISDDGKGFNLKNRKKRAQGLGLTGMQERTALMGGNFVLDSAPGHGTTIHVEVPTSTRRKRKALQADADTEWQ